MQYIELHNVEYGECIVLGGGRGEILMVDCGSVSQRLRAQIHRRLPKTYALELAKWAATLGLCLTMPPRRSVWLLRMRCGISRGLFS